MRSLSIYLHIPFCAKKCRYCDFLSYPAAETEQEAYLTALLTEIEKQSFFYKGHQVVSVFIGGGTPSVLKLNAIETLIEKLKQNYIFSESPEITIEVNPGTVSAEKLAAYYKAGINRLSIGLQSADDNELRTLGRIHDYAAFCNTYEMAGKAGFHNINVDLMSAIPGQTIDSYRETLKKVLSLSPEHISAYSLILEEGTWFYEHREQLSFPTEDEDRLLYELTGEMLAAAGYHRYEISNYAKTGYECRHNKVYWQRGDYVGFGIGAASMVEEVRWNNRRNFNEYSMAMQAAGEFQDSPDNRNSRNFRAAAGNDTDSILSRRCRFGENIQYLTRKEQMEEFMFLGLRLTAGVGKEAFYQKFGVPVERVYGEVLEKLKRDKLLMTDDCVRLTPYGMDISNYVMAQFLL